MKENSENLESLRAEIAELKAQLYEANNVIDAIKDGAVDALVVTIDGNPQVYSIESADYTYRILIEKFGEGALSISEDGLILYCNDHFSKLIGIPANVITGTYFNTYVDSESELIKLTEGLKNGPSKGEIALIANGKKLHVYASLTDLQPNVAAIGVVITDLTEKIQNEEALLQYQQNLELKVHELNLTNTNLEQFIHVISHDLKEPLRKILTYTSHLGETRPELFSATELKNLTVINSSAHRLNSLVDDLVKYAFSSTKDSGNDTTAVDLNTVVKEVTEDLELIITENKALIQYDELPVITASRVQMRQLFANLISNAIKYSKTDIHPKITISTEIVANTDFSRTSEKYFVVAVHDNGIGMEKSHLSKIFTIFQRLHMRNEYSGNGIGLAICKKIMENHQGKIEVESTLNQGSIFKLYFPVKA